MQKENPGGLLQSLRRRDVIAMLGGAAVAWAIAARAQQTAMPVIGFLFTGSRGRDGSMAQYLAAYQQALSEIGYVEGQNLAIEYRWAGAATIDCLPWPQTSWAGKSI